MKEQTLAETLRSRIAATAVCMVMAAIVAWPLRAAEPGPSKGPATAPSAATAVLQDEIIFTQRGRNRDGHYYTTVGYSCATEEKFYSRVISRLCRFDPKSGKLTEILKEPNGSIRDAQVDYSGTRILFSWCKKGSEYHNLYEIGIDGQGLRQVTSGPWDDYEPCYLPDGGIIFTSTRAKRYVGCWYAPAATLFRCNNDGSGLRMLTSSAFTENSPSVLPDGRVIFTRWEYVNRAPTVIHHLWTMHPNGTAQQLYYGLDAHVLIDAQAIPGTRDVVFVETSHAPGDRPGAIMIGSDRLGTSEPKAMRCISPAPEADRPPMYRDPYPVTATTFLVAKDSSILLLDSTTAKTTEIYKGQGLDISEPRPLRSRPRELIIPDATDANDSMATLFVGDVCTGRAMAGMERGAVKKLLVLEQLPKPVVFHGGGTTPLSHGYTFALNRILGTVPVEADGSACFKVPPRRSIYLALLDDKDRSIKLMRSFMTLQPGERRSCVGCHEERTQSPLAVSRMAMSRPPSRIERIDGAPDIVDFPRDVQPILDKNCVSCHSAQKREGGVVLTGHRGPTYSLAFYNLILHGQMVDGGYGGNDIPYKTYSSASPMMKKIDGSHHDVKLTPAEQTVIRLWVDTGAQYAGTYAASGTGQIGGWWSTNHPIREMAHDWPSTEPAKKAVERRCYTCHTTAETTKGYPLPRYLTDDKRDNGMGTGEYEGYGGGKFRTSRHMIFDLTVPEESLILMVPLAYEKGGYAKGQAPADGKLKPAGHHMAFMTLEPGHQNWVISPNPYTHHVVFQSTEDPDYQAILAHVKAGQARLNEIKRFDMPGFRPCKEYVREMIRFGVLSSTFDLSKDAIDVYQTDQQYYKLFSSDPK